MKWKGNEIVLKVISYTQNTILVQKLYISHWSKIFLRNTLVIDGLRRKNRDDSEEE